MKVKVKKKEKWQGELDYDFCSVVVPFFNGNNRT